MRCEQNHIDECDQADRLNTVPTCFPFLFFEHTIAVLLHHPCDSVSLHMCEALNETENILE